MLSFRLYVTGTSVRGRTAAAQLHELCLTHAVGECEIEVIDVCARPAQAAIDRVLATPTVLRTDAGGAGRRTIGTDLATPAAAEALGLGRLVDRSWAGSTIVAGTDGAGMAAPSTSMRPAVGSVTIVPSLSGSRFRPAPD